MRIISVLLVGASLLTAGVVYAAPPPTGPHPDHVVIVMMENKRYDSVVGHRKTPYISGLARRGANFAAAYGETHPSQPNYLALFSGSTQGVTDNRCGHTFHNVPNLARQLLDAGHTFVGYAEDLPAVGSPACASGTYVRRHNPWVNFDNVPAEASRPLTDLPSDYDRLPTVSFVVPGLCHDMHDCPKADADAWLHDTLGGYIDWAETHNSLLVLTFDEDNHTDGNHIPTIVIGAGVTPGDRTARVDHYTILRTIEEAYGLPLLGAAASAGTLALH